LPHEEFLHTYCRRGCYPASGELAFIYCHSAVARAADTMRD